MSCDSRHHARLLLAEGRHAPALVAIRKARKARGGDDALMALQEWEALAGLARYREALALATRALGRPLRDADLAVRLRIARGLALWLTGRSAPGLAEVRKAVEGATLPLTRARALEALGLLAWRGQDLERAGLHLEAALHLYDAAGNRAGMVRALQAEAGVLHDAGRLGEALSLQERAIQFAYETGRVDLIAEVRSARGWVLAAMGRWDEARQDANAAASALRESAEPREHARAAIVSAILDLAAGDLAAAREALVRARESTPADGSDPRNLAEIRLLTSDLHLAWGGNEAAETEATGALGLFVGMRDRDGECRSRVRRAHALLAQGRASEAEQESRRAQKAVAPSRPNLRALVQISLGRALLRSRPREAGAAFGAALALSGGRSGLAGAARLGRALARRDDEEASASLTALEAWGDRRILSFCLADLREVRGVEAEPCAPLLSQTAESDPASAALVDAASALLGDGDWRPRWSAAMRAVRGVVPWCRAVLVGQPGWELRRDLEMPEPLSPRDLAVELAARSQGPVIVDLANDPVLRLHPVRVMHGLQAALLAPVSPGIVLYADLREGCAPPDERALGLLTQLARLLSQHLPEGTDEEQEQARARPPGLIGRSAPMESLFEELARVAALDVSVHVYGETGTGKERVAEFIHRSSSRAEGPWVPVNASSLSDELFESEMFGHVKGAFTGALADRQGYAAEAAGGTLFLDEVTDLSPRAQAKLLRFVQQREYRRVGDPRLHRANVRILTASNVTLESRVAAGLFRADLMYRLGQATLTVPPLRERGDDVVLLARHFLRGAASSAGRPVPGASPEVWRILTRHAWPGNVRELESEMARIVPRAGRGPIRREHLSASLCQPASTGLAPLRQALADFEREHIIRALRHNGGNRARTAGYLGLTRQALVAKISRLGISSPPR